MIGWATFVTGGASGIGFAMARSFANSGMKVAIADVEAPALERAAAKAIDWLCDAFGFERHLVVPGENGSIAHAQLAFGNGMIMLGSAGDGHFYAYQKTPADVGGIGSYDLWAQARRRTCAARRCGSRIALCALALLGAAEAQDHPHRMRNSSTLQPVRTGPHASGCVCASA